jgi:hypothetical protein
MDQVIQYSTSCSIIPGSLRTANSSKILSHHNAHCFLIALQCILPFPTLIYCSSCMPLVQNVLYKVFDS